MEINRARIRWVFGGGGGDKKIGKSESHFTDANLIYISKEGDTEIKKANGDTESNFIS